MKYLYYLVLTILTLSLASAYIDIDNTGEKEWLNLQTDTTYYQDFESFYNGLNSISNITFMNNGSCNITLKVLDRSNNKELYNENIGNVSGTYTTDFHQYSSLGKTFRIIIKEETPSKKILHKENYTIIENKNKTGCYIAVTNPTEELRGNNNLQEEKELELISGTLYFQSHTKEENKFYKLTNAETNPRKILRELTGGKEDLKTALVFYILATLIILSTVVIKLNPTTHIGLSVIIISVITFIFKLPFKGIPLYAFYLAFILIKNKKYKEKVNLKSTTNIFISILIIGTLLRLFGISLSPVWDEYYHLLAAKSYILQGSYVYSRSEFIKQIIAFMFTITNSFSIVAARIPFIIAGILTGIFLYLTGKEHNKLTGLIVTALWYFSPYIIGMNQFLREYSINALIFSILTYYFIKTFRYKKRNIIEFSIASLITLIYILNIKGTSYFGIPIIISYIGLSIFWRINEKIKKYKFPIYISLVSIGIIFLNWFFLKYPYYISGFKNIRLNFLTFFFDSIYTNISYFENIIPHTYSIIPFIQGIFILIFIFSLFTKEFYKRKEIISILIVVLAYLFGFSLLYTGFSRARYLFYLTPLIYLFISYCITIAYSYSKHKKIAMIAIILIFANPILSLYLNLETANGEYDQRTGLLHRDLDKLEESLRNLNYSNETTIITTEYNIFSYFYYNNFVTNSLKNNNTHNIDHSDIYILNYDNRDKIFLCEVIHAKDSGLIIISDERNNKTWLNEVYINKSEKCNQTSIIFEKNTDAQYGFQIFSWDKNETIDSARLSQV